MMGKTSSAGEFFEADIVLVFVVVVHRILLQFWVNNSKVVSLLMNFVGYQLSLHAFSYYGCFLCIIKGQSSNFSLCNSDSILLCETGGETGNPKLANSMIHSFLAV
jgi:hypothetical protein